MIDFHNHVLPNVDDGSHNLDMSISMLEFAAEQGITDVVNTVHFQHPKVELEDISYSRISNEVKRLNEELHKNNINVKIHSGAEVFYLPNLLSLKDNPLVTFERSGYMLIEFQVHQLPTHHLDQFFKLRMSGVTPIIAHPERYKFVQDDTSLVPKWINLGCLIQVDAGSVLGTLGKGSKYTSERIIKNGWCHILGSDAHDDKKKLLFEGITRANKKWIGDDANALVYNNQGLFLKGKKYKLILIMNLATHRTFLRKL